MNISFIKKNEPSLVFRHKIDTIFEGTPIEIEPLTLTVGKCLIKTFRLAPFLYSTCVFNGMSICCGFNTPSEAKDFALNVNNL